MNAETSDTERLRFACDAMCGGLTRWLRALGYDCFYREGIDDGELVEVARRERRMLLSGDSRMFERRLLASGQVPSLQLPRGLKLMDQLAFVVERLGLTCATPRCMDCNGELDLRSRGEVADRVPARSLLWADEFFECRDCGKVYWNGTHWRRIEAVRRRVMERGM